MRLINCQSLELEEHFNDIPPYAILSHTWGGDEVSFQNMQQPDREKKLGFQKIALCCRQALKDGFRYAWVDTCNIDKTSSAELSEAINSMFKWYAKAEVCYAYLEDVGSGFGRLSDEVWLESRWFTRGWTLQELLAPKNVIFFAEKNSVWTPLATRNDHAEAISKETRIPVEALKGNLNRVKEFSIAQRMSWASDRVTTREEDIAYCLLGLFDVNMPLLYGEGNTRAFVRLQEEIMKSSDDESLFAWSNASSGELFIETGLLADHPWCFRDSLDLVPVRDWTDSKASSITNKGLRLEMSIFNGPIKLPGDLAYLMESQEIVTGKRHNIEIAVLHCRSRSSEPRYFGIIIRPLFPQGDQYCRCVSELIPVHSPWDSVRRVLYFRQQIIKPESILLESPALSVVFVVKKLSGCPINVVSINGEPRNQNLKSSAMLVHPPPIQSIHGYWFDPSSRSWESVVELKLCNGLIIKLFLGMDREQRFRPHIGDNEWRTTKLLREMEIDQENQRVEESFGDHVISVMLESLQESERRRLHINQGSKAIIPVYLGCCSDMTLKRSWTSQS